jgi:Methyltransferase domain
VSELETLVDGLIERAELTGATLSRPRHSDPSGYAKVTVEPVAVRGALRYRWRYHYATQTTDEHLAPDDTAVRLVRFVAEEFRQAHLRAVDADYQVLAGSGRPTILRRPPSKPDAPMTHDREKRHVLADGVPVPFLVELGVQTREGKVRAQRRDKFRQVNRFLELVEDILPALPAGRLRIVDFGSGKSYLTFALHHLLTVVHRRDVDLVGLDLREDVVATCSALAAQLELESLRFEVGEIADYRGVDAVDLVVSLHACDTATDDALERAVTWNAPVILAVPCCQHELSSQLRGKEADMLAPLLGRGLLRERFASDATDAARAQLLEAVGYDVQLVEFVQLEHTPKNVLIRAVRRPGRDREQAYATYRSFADGLGIEPALERLLVGLLPRRPA